jgi:hypothetical protein
VRGRGLEVRACLSAEVFLTDGLDRLLQKLDPFGQVYSAEYLTSTWAGRRRSNSWRWRRLSLGQMVFRQSSRASDWQRHERDAVVLRPTRRTQFKALSTAWCGMKAASRATLSVMLALAGLIVCRTEARLPSRRKLHADIALPERH